MTKSVCQANELMFPTTAPGRPGRPLCPGRPISPCSPLAPWETDTTGIKQLYLFPHRAAPLLRNPLGGDSQQLITDRWGGFILPRMTDVDRQMLISRQLHVSSGSDIPEKNLPLTCAALRTIRKILCICLRLSEEVCKYLRIMFGDHFHQCSSSRVALLVQHFVLDPWSDFCKSVAKRLAIFISRN